jgi:hypothetical protein|tara:strand:+ start:4109 stop:4219 length:111 start_codon:yes stop_codon:yes gene_type:complete
MFALIKDAIDDLNVKWLAELKNITAQLKRIADALEE